MNPPKGFTEAQWQQAIDDLVERTRKAQGLPRHVTDPVVLDRIARLMTVPKMPKR